MYAPVSIERNERDRKDHLQQMWQGDSCSRRMRTEGVFSVDYTWGYFSDKDGERHSFDLCESCYDELLRTFRIPAEIEGIDAEKIEQRNR